jgi:hypothetical protein
LANTGPGGDLAALQGLVPAAVAVAREHLRGTRAAWDELIAGQLRTHESRLDRWEQLSLDFGPVTAGRRVRETAVRQRRLADSLRTAGEPYLRVLAVLEAAR